MSPAPIRSAHSIRGNAWRAPGQPAPRRQRGAAALIVTMVLFFAMLLAAAFANRNLVFEQRTSTNQYRSTQAFEAAEAGLEWALAQINSPLRIGPDCRPTADASAPAFRERFLGAQVGTGGFSGATWADGTSSAPLQPACVRAQAGWNCSCPAAGHPQPVAPAGPGIQPAFTLQFAAGGKPGLVKVIARGCTSLAGACLPGSATTTDSSARVEVTLGLLPALGTPPAAALTARGRLDTATAWGAHNPDSASSGLAVHVGGAIQAPLLRVTPPAGTPLADASVAGDTSLSSLTADRFFSTTFGLDKTGWKNQPTVRTLDCSGNCSALLAEAIATSGGSPMVWVAGDLVLDGPLDIGSPQHPVVLVAQGSVTLNGPVRLHGVLYGGSVAWNDTATPGALLRGALISEGDVLGGGSPDIYFDAAVLSALKANGGSFARVSGSWRDF